MDEQPTYAGRTAGVSSAPPSPFPTPKNDPAQQETASVRVIFGLTPLQSKPPETITAKSVKGKEASQPNTPTPSSVKLTAQESALPGTPIPSPTNPPGSVKMVSSQLLPLKPAKNDATPAEPSGVAQAVTAGVVGKEDRRETDAKIGGEEMDEEAPAMAATMRKVLVATFDVSQPY